MIKLTNIGDLIRVENTETNLFREISKDNTVYTYYPVTGEFVIYSRPNKVYYNLGTIANFLKDDDTHPADIAEAKEYLNSLFAYDENPPSYSDLTLWANSTKDNEIVDNIAANNLTLGGSSVIDMSAGDNYMQTTDGYTSSPYIYFRGCFVSVSGWIINRRSTVQLKEYELFIYSGLITLRVATNIEIVSLAKPVSKNDRIELIGYYDKANSLLVFNTNINNAGWEYQSTPCTGDIVVFDTYTTIGKAGWSASFYSNEQIEELILKDYATDTELIHLTGRGGGSYTFNEATGEPLLIQGTTTNVWQKSTDQTPYNYNEGFSLMSNGSDTYRAPFKTDGTVIYAVDDVDNQGYTCISVHEGVSDTTTHNYSENTIIPPFVQAWYDIPLNGTYNDLFYNLDKTSKEIDPNDLTFDYNDAGYLFADVSDATKIKEILMYLTQKTGTDLTKAKAYVNAS